MAKRRRSREFKNNQVIDIETARKKRRERRQLAASGKDLKPREPREEPSRRREIKNLRRRIVYGGIFIMIAIVIGFSVYNVISLKTEEAQAEAKLKALEQQKIALEEELSRIDSKEYIEQQAREELRMILPGETLYVLRNKGENEETATD